MTAPTFVDYPGRRLLGWGHALQRSPIRFMMEVKRVCGDFARLRLLGPVHVYLVSSPEAIERILLTNGANYKRGRTFDFLRRSLGNGLLSSDGDYHRSQRRMIEPGFRRRTVGAYLHHVHSSTDRMLRDWADSREAAIDVNFEMLKLTMVMTGHVLFSVDLVDEARELRLALQEGAELVGKLARAPFLLPQAVPTQTNRRIAAINGQLDSLVLELIRKRREVGTAGAGDILSMLLEVQAASRSDPVGGAVLGDRAMRDELIGLFAAGQETTASWLSWALYYLAINPTVLRRLQDEVDAVVDGPLPVAEDLPRLPYLKQVLEETLRIMPPTWGNVREAVADDVIEGRRVPAGARIFLSPYLVHRDARWYPDPDRFDPDRFAAESPAMRRRFIYFPFGAGPHHCIGKFLAELEATFVLTAIVQRYELRLDEGRVVDFQETTTVQPKGGLPMTLVPRASRRVSRLGQNASVCRGVA